MFLSTAPILRWSSPEGRGLRRMGRRLNDAFTSACLDEKLEVFGQLLHCSFVHN